MGDIKFDITMEPGSNLSPSHQHGHEESTSFIDEEGLLPGAPESRETSGFLPLTYVQHNAVDVQFEPINTQHALHDMALKSKGMDLHYELTNNNKLLIATQGTTDIAVFTAYLDKNGTYTFTLHNHIDRSPPLNLVTNEHEAWKIQTHESISSKVSMFQEIGTQPLEPYQLTFHHQPTNSNDSNLKDIQVYWGDRLLYTIPPHQQEGKGYTFSVEGNAEQASTKLQFVSAGEHFIKENIHDVSLTSTAQNKLPIDLGYIVFDNDGNVSHSEFTVNVTTTPPIQLSNHEPFDVIFDQSVYQTIIVNEENGNHTSPLTTINLDTLFNHLAIPAENRVVEVIQREENGLGTNVYEVKISDKSQPLLPITVADVQLSFPGGDGGINVFHKHIIIDGGGSSLPPLDHHFI